MHKHSTHSTTYTNIQHHTTLLIICSSSNNATKTRRVHIQNCAHRRRKLLQGPSSLAPALRRIYMNACARARIARIVTPRSKSEVCGGGDIYGMICIDRSALTVCVFAGGTSLKWHINMNGCVACARAAIMTLSSTSARVCGCTADGPCAECACGNKVVCL